MTETDFPDLPVIVGHGEEPAAPTLAAILPAARRLVLLATEITRMDAGQLEAHRKQFQWRMLKAAISALSAAIGDDKKPTPTTPQDPLFQKGR